MFVGATEEALASVDNPVSREPLPPDPEDEPFPLLPITSQQTLKHIVELPLRNGDVFICSYPKSGTTWLQHIVHTLVTNGNSPLDHISRASPFLEADRSWCERSAGQLAPWIQSDHSMIGPRLFNTHMLWRLLPKLGMRGLGNGARYIYASRRGRDACVSFFHHLSHMAPEDGGYTGTFDEFVSEWAQGDTPFGSWSAHLKAWHSKAAADPRGAPCGPSDSDSRRTPGMHHRPACTARPPPPAHARTVVSAA